jgi:carotenoid cleavage dioxygenase-like enzyme
MKYYFYSNGTKNHIFTIKRYEIKNGEVVFSSRFIRSDWYRRIVENQEDIPPSITTGPVVPPFNNIQKLVAAVTSSTKFDNVPVNIHPVGGKSWVAVTDAPVMIEFDPATLETKGRFTYQNEITSPGGIELFSTAHPHLRKEKRRLSDTEGYEIKEFTYNYFFELRPIPLPGLPASNLAHVVRIDERGRREVVGTVPVSGTEIPYVHDFSMTKNYIVLFIWPVRIEASKMVSSDRGFLRELDWCGPREKNTL